MRPTQKNFVDLMIACSMLLIARVAGDDTTEYYDWWEPINITEFLDTSDNIWTVITTANDSQDCKVDKKQFINRTNILFSREFQTPQHENISTELLGTFRDYEPYVSMEVGPKDGNATGLEELIYQGINNTCGVFELRNVSRVITAPCYYLYNRPCWQYRAFDIRVRGFVGNVSAQECWKWFNETYPQETFQRILYKSRCNNITRIDMKE
ncbi:uncharacterized protein LOC142587738 [Dermacentor variabilis]|uniref:uncharacterized protein LOC142587738 n=1 Tax=Dermacentor variabilis TaxID=34621 RepID=UPI003F5B6AF2